MKADRREEILGAAQEIVHEGGIEALHARSIAAKIGVNHAAVHYYFKTRDDLVLALCERLGRQLADDRAAALEGPDRLKGHFHQARSYCQTDSAFIAVFLACWQYAQSHPATHTELVRLVREWMVVLGLELRKAKSLDGETLVASFIGLATVARLLGDDFDFRSKIKGLLKLAD